MKIYLQQKSDHPGYSCERASWALVTGVGPFLNRLLLVLSIIYEKVRYMSILK